MDKEKLLAGGIGYDRAVMRFMGNAAFYEHFLKEFVNDTCMERARTAMAAKDYDALMSATHELKSVSGNLEITDVYHYSSEIVAHIRAENYTALPSSFTLLEEAYNKALNVLNTMD